VALRGVSGAETLPELRLSAGHDHEEVAALSTRFLLSRVVELPHERMVGEIDYHPRPALMARLGQPTA
jgi:hypothetical protein